jgi:hypothetical protein
MFYNLPTKKWSFKMIAENFQDWLLQGCIERDAEKREKKDLDGTVVNELTEFN